MKYIFLIVTIVILLMSCNKDDSRKIVHEPKNPTELKKDTSIIEIADLPIQLDSTNYLIHPIGYYKVYKSRLGSYSSDYNDGKHFSVSNNGDNYITGNLSNVSFQHIDSINLKPLTDKIIQISSIRFLKDIYKKSGKTVIIYEVRDRDTNNDKKLDYGDVNTLYISNIDGSNFTKLIPEFEELLDWKTILSNNQLYFSSIEDTNKNGEFDKKDNTHYYSLNLNLSHFKPVEYFPLQIN